MSGVLLAVPSWPTVASGFVAVLPFVGVTSLAGGLDYNTRVVLLGTILMGIAAGLVGALMVLRRLALIGDVASHAALPGIGLAWLAMEAVAPGQGKWTPGLLLGATLSATLGLGLARGLGQLRRVKEDAALAICLSLFFGGGIVLLTWIQGLPRGKAAGLQEFLFGKAAGLLASDVLVIAVMAGAIAGLCLMFAKVLAVLCFDPQYASATGWPVLGLDALLTGLVIVVTVIGMQSVGLLLIVGLMVLPPTAARFWTDRFGHLLVISGVLGGLSAAGGVMLSAAWPKLAAGAVIILVGTALFVVSWLLGARRGVLWQWRAERQLRTQIQRADLLRAIFEVLEPSAAESGKELVELTIPRTPLAQRRGLDDRAIDQSLGLLERAGLLRKDAQGQQRLTSAGQLAARQAARQHRLWELYLIHFGSVPANAVDRQADLSEHGLDPAVLAELEQMLARSGTPVAAGSEHAVPANPHADWDRSSLESHARLDRTTPNQRRVAGADAGDRP